MRLLLLLTVLSVTPFTTTGVSIYKPTFRFELPVIERYHLLQSYSIYHNPALTGSYNHQYTAVNLDEQYPSNKFFGTSLKLFWDAFDQEDTTRHNFSFLVNWQNSQLSYHHVNISVAYCYDIIKPEGSIYSKRPELKLAIAPSFHIVRHGKEIYGDMIDPRRGIAHITDDRAILSFFQSFVDINAGVYYHHGRISAGYSMKNIRDQYNTYTKNYYLLQRVHTAYMSFKMFLTKKLRTNSYLRYEHYNGVSFSEAGLTAIGRQGVLYQLALVDLNKLKTAFAMNLSKSLDLNLRVNWNITEASKDFGLISSFGLGIRYKSNKTIREKDEIDDPNYGN